MRRSTVKALGESRTGEEKEAWTLVEDRELLEVRSQ
jgi:hypothetical protein